MNAVSYVVVLSPHWPCNPCVTTHLLEELLTGSIWTAFDLCFGCLSLCLTWTPTYLMACLGGRYSTNTRSHPDRSDTVGILPVVKPRTIRHKAWSRLGIAIRDTIWKHTTRPRPRCCIMRSVFSQKSLYETLKLPYKCVLSILGYVKMNSETLYEERDHKYTEAKKAFCFTDEKSKAVWKPVTAAKTAINFLTQSLLHFKYQICCLIKLDPHLVKANHRALSAAAQTLKDL